MDVAVERERVTEGGSDCWPESWVALTVDTGTVRSLRDRKEQRFAFGHLKAVSFGGAWGRQMVPHSENSNTTQRLEEKAYDNTTCHTTYCSTTN